jgi:hypothetical protein
MTTTTAPAASREFLAIDLPEWLVMVNGSQYGAPVTASEAEAIAASYRQGYRLAVVRIENVSEYAAWRI